MSDSLIHSNFNEKQLIEVCSELLTDSFIKVDFSNSVQIKRNWELNMRNLDVFHTVFVRDGGGTYYFDGQRINFEPGLLLIVGPNNIHSAVPDLQNLPYLFTARFGIYSSNGETKKTSKKYPAFALKVKKYREFEDLYNELFIVSQRPDTQLKRVLEGSIVSCIFCEALQEATSVSSTNITMEKVASFINNSPNKQMSCDELASFAGMSRHPDS